MINVDGERKIFKLQGSVPRLLVELEYIFSDLYTQMYVSQGLSSDVIYELLDDARENGIDKAWDAILETRRS